MSLIHYRALCIQYHYPYRGRAGRQINARRMDRMDRLLERHRASIVIVDDGRRRVGDRQGIAAGRGRRLGMIDGLHPGRIAGAHGIVVHIDVGVPVLRCNNHFMKTVLGCYTQ